MCEKKLVYNGRMKIREVRSNIARVIAAVAAFAALKGSAMAEYDFEKAWKDVEAAQMKNLPRTVTNKLDENNRLAAGGKTR